MAGNPFGFGTNLLATLTRPTADPRVLGTADDWAQDCTNPAAQDGTMDSSAWANEITANLRALVRMNGLTGSGAKIVDDDNSDSMLVSALRHYVQRGRANYAVDTGAADTYVITPTPVPPELVDGMCFDVRIGNTNTTTAPTLTIGTSTFQIKNLAGNNVAKGQIPGGQVVRFRYHASTNTVRVWSGVLVAPATVLTLFDAVGAATWTPQATSRMAFYAMWGGGGSGGNGQNGGSASGGCGGEFRFGLLRAHIDYTPGVGVALTVGAGAASNPANGGDGFAGGSSSIAALAQAAGGRGGLGTQTPGVYQAGVANTAVGFGGIAIPGMPSAAGNAYWAGPGGGAFGSQGARPKLIQGGSFVPGEAGAFPGGAGGGSGAAPGNYPLGGPGAKGAIAIVDIGQ